MKIVDVIAGSFNRTATKEMHTAWKIALGDIPKDIIEEAVKIVVKQQDKQFMITSAEFVGICREIRKNRKIMKPEVVEEYKPLSKDEAKKQYSKIQERVSKIPKREKPQEYMSIAEYYNPHGDVEFYMCFGHVDYKTFIENVKYQYYCKFVRVTHEYRVWTTDKDKDTKGNAREYVTYLPCTSASKNCEPVTIGRP
jgi:hypothetical protein